MRALPGWCWMTALLFSQSCRPKVVVFEANPTKVCKGGRALLRWRVNRTFFTSTTLLTGGSHPGEQKVSSSGSQAIVITETTLFGLKASRFGKRCS